MVIEKREESCIVVGLHIDGDGRELLSWALANVAKDGDRVLAVYVSRNQDPSRTPTTCLIKVIDDCLAEHEDLCTRKKVILAGRISRGNSIKKALVKEAEVCQAKALVVGANKNFSFGGSASLAKYCAKKLPSTTALIAVHKGKIILERAAAAPLLVEGGEKKSKVCNFLHPSIVMDTKVIAPSSPRKSDAVAAKKLPEAKLGWPLMRREVAANIEALKDSQARKMSVVHWVMKLPDRSLAMTHSQVDLVKELEIILGSNSSNCKFFHYEELQNSTNYFSPENLIGKGGSSQVYKGCLPDGQQAAIKVSKLSEESSKDFILEVDIITRVQHEHIVSLIGVCVEENNLIPVYSYFSRGSLEENLHGKGAKAPLDWDMRFKVAVGVAQALSYLHDDHTRPVIHRDVKSSNILLSDECKPQLSDFGLAIWAPTESTYLTHSDVFGTFGYMAPEYFMYGKVSCMIDVYAFGVVLLELLTGRRPINDESPKGQGSLVMWAAPILERGEIMDLLDPNLDGKYEEDQMKRLALAASLCIRREAHRRPQMNQILGLLRGEEEVGQWMSSNINRNATEQDCHDEEIYPASSIGSHIGLALLDVDDDASVLSYEQNHLNSLDEYLNDRWSRSSSFE